MIVKWLWSAAAVANTGGIEAATECDDVYIWPSSFHDVRLTKQHRSMAFCQSRLEPEQESVRFPAGQNPCPPPPLPRIAERGRGAEGQRGKWVKGQKGKSEQTSGSTPSVARPTPRFPGQRPTPSAQHPAPNAQHPTPSTQRPTPGAQHPAPSSQLAKPGPRALVVVSHRRKSSSPLQRAGQSQPETRASEQGRRG